jgi:putative ABC transport system substrate-binding protein
MMQRRAFVAGMAAVMAAPVAAVAQHRPARVGWLGGGAGLSPVELRKAPHFTAFARAMQELGYSSGSNLRIETHIVPPGRLEQYSAFAIRLVREADVILANNPYSISAVLDATKSVPIVAIDFESDPIARGWAEAWSKPGGNLTGFFLDIPEITGKHIELLREIRRNLTRLAVLGDPRLNDLQFQASETAARTAGLSVDRLAVVSPAELEGSIAHAGRLGAAALVVLSSPLVNGNLQKIAAAAVRRGLPAICIFAPRFADAGGLLAYGPDFPDFYRRAARYVARILKGAKPGELPLQRPEKFQLVINARTAKALDITLPPSLLLRADHVIE